MLTTQKSNEQALEFGAMLEQLKLTAVPDNERIEAVRGQIDAAADGGAISVREWRQLIEQCSHLRRSSRK